MKHQLAIDTHSTTQELMGVGISEPTARILVFGLTANLNAITKQDVAEIHKEIAVIHKDIEIIHKDIEQLRSDTKKDIEQLRADTKKDIADVRKDIEQLRADTQRDIADVRKDIQQLRVDTKKDIAISNGRHTVIIIGVLGGIMTLINYL